MCQKKNGHHHSSSCQMKILNTYSYFVDSKKLRFGFISTSCLMLCHVCTTQNRIALIQDNLVLLHWHAGVAIYLRPTRFIFVFESLQQLNSEVDYRGLCIFVKIKPNFHKICKKSWTVVLLQIKSPFDMENFKIKIEIIAM